MDWLLLGEFSLYEKYFLFWVFGLIGGYCIGRIHAAYVKFSHWLDENGEL